MSSSVASSQMDAMEAVAQLKGARQLGEALSQSARQQGAQSLASHDAQQALQHHTEQMDPQAQGRYEGSVGGQEAKKAQGGRDLADPVERFAKPLLGNCGRCALAVWVWTRCGRLPASRSLMRSLKPRPATTQRNRFVVCWVRLGIKMTQAVPRHRRLVNAEAVPALKAEAPVSPHPLAKQMAK